MFIKKIGPVLAVACMFISCEDNSVSEEFDDANGNAALKRIASIRIASDQENEYDGYTITMMYNEDGSLHSVTDGEITSVLGYNTEGELETVAEATDVFRVETLFESPYDAFETGNVRAYDEKGNPVIIDFEVEEYDFENYEDYTSSFVANVSYETTPNVFFKTLEAAKAIAVLDNINLNFSMNPQMTELVKARMLFPLNNISKIVYTREDGINYYTVDFSYVYDDDNYPTSITTTTVSERYPENNNERHTAHFTYVE